MKVIVIKWKKLFQAFVKTADVCDYLENRHLYEKTQNRKAEFCCAIQEIKQEAGLPPEGDEQQSNNGESGAPNVAEGGAGAAPTNINNSSSFGRIRKPSARYSDRDFVPFGVNSLRKRQNSNSLNFDFLDRQRTDSTGSIFGNTKCKHFFLNATFFFSEILQEKNESVFYKYLSYANFFSKFK